jgi:S1-C subfamily serine protease
MSLGCAGQRGKAPMRCTDGRRLDVEWIATSCTTGHGEGQDQNGATFRFAFGLNEEEAEARLKELSEEVLSNPELPVYRPKEVRKEKGYSTGTGFFVTNTGIMVTNHHVIEDAKHVYVLDTANGMKFTAEVLVTDPINDVAVIKVEAQSKGIPLANYFTSPKGSEVLTLGYPLIALQGQEQKATFGRINSLSGIKDDIRMVQIDVPIQPGNSGGPLLNSKGEVVGVVTATLDQIVTLRASGSLPQNVNFAVKIDYILPALRKALGGAIPSISDSASEMKMSQIVSLRESSVMLVVAE